MGLKKYEHCSDFKNTYVFLDAPLENFGTENYILRIALGPCKPNWDIGIWVIFPGILGYYLFQIGILGYSLQDLGYQDIDLMSNYVKFMPIIVIPILACPKGLFQSLVIIFCSWVH